MRSVYDNRVSQPGRLRRVGNDRTGKLTQEPWKIGFFMSAGKTFHTEYFDFTPEEIREAAAAGRLLAAEVEFNRECNYRCPYCYADDGSAAAGRDSGLLSGEEIDGVIEQAAALGARKIVILGGEPLLYRDLEARLDRIVALGMRPEIFTNGALLDPERAAMLFRYGARVALKFNSLIPEVQERMTGVKGALDKCLRAVELLREAGYDRTHGMTERTVCWRQVRSSAVKTLTA